MRDTARELYVGELRKHGLTVTYNRFGNHSSSVTVAWSGLRMEREVTDVCVCVCVCVRVCVCVCVRLYPYINVFTYADMNTHVANMNTGER